MEAAEVSELTKSQILAFNKFQKTRARVAKQRMDNIQRPAKEPELQTDQAQPPAKPKQEEQHSLSRHQASPELNEQELDKLLGFSKFNLE